MTLTLPDWPMFGLADDIRPTLGAVMAAGRPCVLVTLLSVAGGGPRPEGTQMLFAEDTVSGFLSGGCVEGDVALHGAETLADGAPRRLVYGQGGPPDIQLLCGARIELLLERVAADDPAARALLAMTQARTPALWISDGVTRRAVAASGDEAICAVDPAPFQVRRLYRPAPRLIVVGADPTALAVAALGAQAGFETTLVRPKGPERAPDLPGVAYSRADPDQALATIGVDRWTAVAVATHDWDIDQAALRAALPSAAPYVGVLGARRRLPERLQRLRAAGLSEADLARLKAPIGLDLGGKAPWEVAVAVIGEIVAERALIMPPRPEPDDLA
jgi:xanthine dehydrogenase accessory factor